MYPKTSSAVIVPHQIGNIFKDQGIKQKGGGECSAAAPVL